jgi:hypothetical protein
MFLMNESSFSVPSEEKKSPLSNTPPSFKILQSSGEIKQFLVVPLGKQQEPRREGGDGVQVGEA